MKGSGGATSGLHVVGSAERISGPAGDEGACRG